MWENPLVFEPKRGIVGSLEMGKVDAGWQEDGTIGLIGVNGSTKWWHLPEPDHKDQGPGARSRTAVGPDRRRCLVVGIMKLIASLTTVRSPKRTLGH